jgi:xanthine dehydrogenase YagR molybdenum-binding subunit
LQAGASGVKLVMSWKNAPKLKPAPLFNSSPKAAGPSDLPIMLDNRIRWNSEAITVVLAETREQADYARSLIRATYEEPAVIDFDEAIKNAREPKHILGEPPIVKESDAEAALSSAPRRVDAVFRTPAPQSQRDRVARRHVVLGRRSTLCS